MNFVSFCVEQCGESRADFADDANSKQRNGKVVEEVLGRKVEYYV